MFKKHLESIIRKTGEENKNLFNFCLTQNERNLKLDSNFFSEFIDSIQQEDIRYYPNLSTVKQKLADSLNLDTGNILLTPGSDIAIKTLFEAIEFENGHFITTDYHFPMYTVYGNLYNIPSKFTEYSRDLTYSISDLLNLIDSKTKLIILANPNSPLGDYKPPQELKRILDTGIPVLIDEAYIELTSYESMIGYLKEYDNLFITRTFSKGLGAAGCRVGYILSNSKNIDILSKFRFMYEIPSISAKYIELVLDRKSIFEQYSTKLLKNKETVVKRLKAKYNSDIIDTDSSWCFIKHTPFYKSIFETYNIGYRTIILPKQEKEYIKFNYDIALEKSEFLKTLIG